MEKATLFVDGRFALCVEGRQPLELFAEVRARGLLDTPRWQIVGYLPPEGGSPRGLQYLENSRGTYIL